MNTQPIQKRSFSTDGTLQVHSIFHTIQGEGPFCGVPAVFIRLAGCNLQCPACDTNYTEGAWTSTVQNILDLVREQATSGLVVITGGEPFRQNIKDLLWSLIGVGFYVQIETNGTLEPVDLHYSKVPFYRSGVYMVCSPKTGKVHPRVAAYACCYKYVLSHDSVVQEDGLPAFVLGHPCTPVVARPPKGMPVYLQPMDAVNLVINQKNLNAVINSCMKHGYTLQLQVHKLLDME